MVAAEQPNGPIVLSAGEPHLSTEDAAANGHAEGIVPAAARPTTNLGGQQVGGPLVGVDRQHPIALGQIESPIALPSVVVEWVLQYPAAKILGDPQCGVARAAVDDDNLIGPCQACQQAGQGAFFVQCDDGGGDGRLAHRAAPPWRCTTRPYRTSQRRL
jgi:hypothetical protein